MTGIKICGLTRATDLSAALDAGADRVGFILAAGSPRTLSFAKAAELATLAKGRASTVTVLVNPTDEDIERIIGEVQPDYLQLHGAETPQRVQQIRANARVPVIKALGIATTDDVQRIADFTPVADEILLDAKPPTGAQRTGGYGHAFDWSLLASSNIPCPWLLAGGLSPDNVAAAITATNAAFVDVSSGVETAPGLKHPDLIQAFVQAVRRTS